MDIVALIGSICFALCGLPAAYESYKLQGCTYPWAFLLLWFAGELLTIIYVIHIGAWILMLNYGVNFFCLLILLHYKLKSTLR